MLPLPLPLYAVCSQHLEVHEEGETIHLDNSQNTEANWTFPPPQAEWDNCRFGPKPLLVSRLQNVLWVWQRESKIFFKKQILKDFQSNCSGSGWASKCRNHALNQCTCQSGVWHTHLRDFLYKLLWMHEHKIPVSEARCLQQLHNWNHQATVLSAKSFLVFHVR